MDTITGVTPTNETLNQDIFSRDTALGKDDFLQLLVAQLRNQDPINPMENTEFIAQLAEFSALEQSQNMAKGLEDLQIIMQSVNNSLASSLIGKNVKFEGNSVILKGENEGIISYQLDKAAQVTIQVYNDDDNLVATLVPGSQSGGSQLLKWTGKGIDGERLPDGKYRFEVEALDGDGNKVNVTTFSVDRVRGLKFDSGNAILTLSESDIYQADVIEILDTQL